MKISQIGHLLQKRVLLTFGGKARQETIPEAEKAFRPRLLMSLNT